MGAAMNNMIGGEFELSLRYGLILYATDAEWMSKDRICAIDYISTYAKDFHFDDTNLNGYGEYRQGEYLSRQSLSDEAIRIMVLQGILDINETENGFMYRLNEVGKAFCQKLSGSYAENFLQNAVTVCDETDHLSDKELQKLIYDTLK